MAKHAAIGAILATFLPVAILALGSWADDQTVQQRLAAGQVAVKITFDGNGSRMKVNAAVRINASPEVIWRVLTDCDHAASFIPGVTRCRHVEKAPDDSWEIIEQESKYSWLMPSVTTVVRVDYKPPQRIDFKEVSGDLREEYGMWMLESSSPTHGDGTILEYELHVDPGFWIPRMLLRHSLRTELPAVLKALRARAESTTGHTP